MTPAYNDEEVDAAIERIAGDVERRFEIPEFGGPAMVVLLEELRRMEKARRSGDLDAAALSASIAGPALELYRPTNSTSRSKAILAEVLAQVVSRGASPEV